MNQNELLKEITATYQKFGWTLQRVLLTANIRSNLAETLNSINKRISIEDEMV